MFVKLNNLRKWSSSKSQVSFEKQIEKRIRNLKITSRIIQNIYANKPAGLVHAQILNKIVKRPIQIWQNERVVFTCGKTHGSKPVIEAEYRKFRNGVGHWSLRGGKDALATSQNGCLYEVVASQTGFDSLELKRKATIVIRQDSYVVAKALLASDESLLMGGARYTGRSSADAQRLLDASQNGQCHPEGRSGHPRGHASHPQTDRVDDTVETYSYARWRSGFLSRADQDVVCHHTLVTNSARDLMEELNRGRFKEARHVGRNELDYYPLPQAQIWDGGNKQGSPGDFRTVCLVGKHFLNQHNDAYADLFVLTFYPTL